MAWMLPAHSAHLADKLNILFELGQAFLDGEQTP